MYKLMFLPILVLIQSICATVVNDAPQLLTLTAPVDHGEGPSWDAKKNLLYYVDIPNGGVLSYNFKTGDVKSVKVDGEASPVVQCRSPNKLVVGVNRNLVALQWDGLSDQKLGEDQILTTVADRFPKSHFNDGKADKKGRLWFGTMGGETNGQLDVNNGILYKITKSNLKSPQEMLTNVSISNGLAWNKANNKFYYIDTPTNKIVSYDYNNEKGEIQNRKVVFDFNTEPTLTGSPDGMTIDADDNLWIAIWGGASVIKVNPTTGKLLQRLSLPAKFVTSAMFGGPDLDILFVTTSRRDLNEQERKVWPTAGALFAFKNLGVKGLPVFEADL